MLIPAGETEMESVEVGRTDAGDTVNHDAPAVAFQANVPLPEFVNLIDCADGTIPPTYN